MSHTHDDAFNNASCEEEVKEEVSLLERGESWERVAAATPPAAAAAAAGEDDSPSHVTRIDNNFAHTLEAAITRDEENTARQAATGSADTDSSTSSTTRLGDSHSPPSFPLSDNQVLLFVKRLHEGSDEEKESAAEMLGQAAAYSLAQRDLVLASEALPALLAACVPDAPIGLLRRAVHAMGAISSGDPPPVWSTLSPMLPVLAQLQKLRGDEELALHMCTLLTSLSDKRGGDQLERLKAIVAAGCVRPLVEHLLARKLPLQSVALAAVCNIAMGDETQAQALLDSGMLPCCRTLLVHSNSAIRRDACRALGHLVSACTTEQLQVLIDAQILPVLAARVRSDDPAVQREAAIVLSRIATRGSDAQIRYAAAQGVVQRLCLVLLWWEDTGALLEALSALEAILAVGAADAYCDALVSNTFTHLLDAAKGREALRALQKHECRQVREKAFLITAAHFPSIHEKTQPSAATTTARAAAAPNPSPAPAAAAASPSFATPSSSSSSSAASPPDSNSATTSPPVSPAPLSALSSTPAAPAATAGPPAKPLESPPASVPCSSPPSSPLQLALAGLKGDSPTQLAALAQLRDLLSSGRVRGAELLAEDGALDTLLRLLANAGSLEAHRDAAWILRRLWADASCTWAALAPSLKCVANGLLRHTDEQLLVDACAILAAACGEKSSPATQSQIDAVVELDVVKRLVVLLIFPNVLVAASAAAVVSCIAERGSKEHGEKLLDLCVLPCLLRLLVGSESEPRAHAVTATAALLRSCSQQMLLDTRLVPAIVEAMRVQPSKPSSSGPDAGSSSSSSSSSGNSASASDAGQPSASCDAAAQALCLVVRVCSDDQLRCMVQQQGVLKPLCDLLPPARAAPLPVLVDALTALTRVQQLLAAQSRSLPSEAVGSEQAQQTRLLLDNALTLLVESARPLLHHADARVAAAATHLCHNGSQ